MTLDLDELGRRAEGVVAGLRARCTRFGSGCTEGPCVARGRRLREARGDGGSVPLMSAGQLSTCQEFEAENLIRELLSALNEGGPANG